MPYPYQFRLEIIKLITEQDFGISEVAKRYQIPHSVVISWLKTFRERGLEGDPISITKKREAKNEKENNLSACPYQPFIPKHIKSDSVNLLTCERRMPT